ncbi:hypothetical protein N7499_012153 [Penicillium canescens]|uniref:Uncharacterized protein n=1 Tax=Penicillium canescens TaxID=5083 RepID=A0AAD6IFU2_PENCN|nr:uncharacterized protein N7446_003367 [Penicillium canescens]KAJ5996013.1 hypothetical protein N7522_007673 [Penicillium canescens]KAJ6045165.1 hypothetical protein N7460_006520 [Penicillium canescens]KAJ6056635.1 hypothetical protein N7444_005733 [Penicillium canescens]KAJ6066079.1 hypothetical protein N7499_012153 [Penicillium canescens]KAJ6075590.1 hypothetical protein N7446_003367 [Penicillium canescens]
MGRPNWLREEDTDTDPSEGTGNKNKSKIKREEGTEFSLKNNAKYKKPRLYSQMIVKELTLTPFAARTCVSLQDFPPEPDVDVAAQRAAEFESRERGLSKKWYF